MICYRVQAFIDTDWVNSWCPTLAEAKSVLKDCARQGWRARLDKVDVPTSREGLCAALNLADANHLNFTGELIAREP